MKFGIVVQEEMSFKEKADGWTDENPSQYLSQFKWAKNRGSYMSAHVFLNLLKELRKRDKMWGLSHLLSLLRNEFNKFNNTRSGMLDSINHMK